MRKAVLFLPFLLTGCAEAPVSSFSAELHVDEDFPSIYLFHEKNDPTVPAKGSEALAEALSFFEVDSRFDLFQNESGGDVALHGFGVTEELSEASRRMGNALLFLKERGF